MKNIMHKTTLREIRGSLGRWMAILAIVALGVGFFCGLKMCKNDFMKTGDEYVLSHNFYNYKLLTTLGLEEEDVKIIEAAEGVKAAEGSWSSDVLVSDGSSDGAELVFKFHTLLDDMNYLELKAGQLPSESNQFAGDRRYFTEADLGRKITLTSTNDEDTLDLFAHETYELVGIVDSPEYLNHERGTTSLGSGAVSGFAYIPAEGWDSEIYTEIYVDFEEDYTIFSDEYEAHDAVMKNGWKLLWISPVSAVMTLLSTRHGKPWLMHRQKWMKPPRSWKTASVNLPKVKKSLPTVKKNWPTDRKKLKTTRKK